MLCGSAADSGQTVVLAAKYYCELVHAAKPLQDGDVAVCQASQTLVKHADDGAKPVHFEEYQPTEVPADDAQRAPLHHQAVRKQLHDIMRVATIAVVG